MRNWPKKILSGVLALLLALSVCATPAFAMTADELKMLLQELYVDEIDEAVLEQDTIQGILDVLGDPYTRYMTPEEFQMLMESMSDAQVGGVGVSIMAQEDGLLIMVVYEDTPAAAAGFKPGDLIVEIDGQSTVDVDSSVSVDWLRGEAGSKVSIKVQRADGSTYSKTLTRTVVEIPSTEHQRLTDNLSYIYSTNFGDTTLRHFTEAIDSYKENTTVWMVDLRDNPGGDVDVTAQVLGLFLGEGIVTYMRNGNDEYVLFSSRQEIKTIEPTIVLTSEWTASAAEMFSGVLRDAENGIAIGEKTYGKGVAQVILTQNELPEIFPDGDAMAITAYRYYTMAGNGADQIGIIPTLLVDAEIAPGVGILLSAVDPKGAKDGYLSFSIGGWRWYVEEAMITSSPDFTEAFTHLLEALPPRTAISRGAGASWNPVTIATLVSDYNLPYRSRSFTDVGTGDRADHINTLATYEILLGDGNGHYRPDDTMTRAEFCALITQAMGLTGSGKTPFTDVAEGEWYVQSISAAYEAGLMNGIGDGLFSPQGTVSEEEMITVMGRMFTTLNTFMYEMSKDYDAAAANVPGDYSDWSKQWVWMLSQSQEGLFGEQINLLFDDPANIPARRAASRSEAGELLYSLYSYLYLIYPID